MTTYFPGERIGETFGRRDCFKSIDAAFYSTASLSPSLSLADYIFTDVYTD